MPVNKLIFLFFIGFCHCHDIVESIPASLSFSPKMKIDFIKRTIVFLDEQMLEPRWTAKELTCNEVNLVVLKLNESMGDDLRLLMAEGERLLQEVPPSGNRRMRKCVEDIKEQIDDAVQEGVVSFSACASLSFVNQRQERTKMQKTRNDYNQIIKYIQRNMDRCLNFSPNFSTKRSEVYKDQCIKNTEHTYQQYFQAHIMDSFNDSKCMAHFKNNVLNCVFDVFNRTASKKMQLKQNLKLCVGYSFINNSGQRTYDIGTTDMLSNYIASYNKQIETVSQEFLNNFTNLTLRLMRHKAVYEAGSSGFRQCQDMKTFLHAYYDALNKSRVENRTKDDRRCYDQAIEEMQNLVYKGAHDLDECNMTIYLILENGVNSLKNISSEFNTKLEQAGNVALLRCFGKRPQDIFNTKSIEDCAKLAEKRFQLEAQKTEVKLKNLVSSLQEEQIIKTKKNYGPDNEEGMYDITCGALRTAELLLDADTVLNNCSRCLYGQIGYHYAVTTPSVYTARDVTTKRFIPRPRAFQYESPYEDSPYEDYPNEDSEESTWSYSEAR